MADLHEAVVEFRKADQLHPIAGAQQALEAARRLACAADEVLAGEEPQRAAGFVPPAAFERGTAFYLDDVRGGYKLGIYVDEQGDAYVSILPEGFRASRKSVRLCASGGAAEMAPGLLPAIRRAFEAIRHAATQGGRSHRARHVASVDFIPSGTAGTCRRGVCTCGWHGGDRATLQLAADDAAEHERAAAAAGRGGA